MLGPRRLFGAPPSFYPDKVPFGIRLSAARQGYLSRTPTVAGNRKKFALSLWFDPCIPVTTYGPSIFEAGTVTGSESTYFAVSYSTGQTILISSWDINWFVGSTLLRDFTHFLHLCVHVDTTQANPADRIKVWLNNIPESPAGYTPPTLNVDTAVNSLVEHKFGKRRDLKYMDLYAADIHLVDGQNPPPATFVQYSPRNSAVLVPKRTTGLDYGVNGFHPTFDESGNMGKDGSGLGNHWTASGLNALDQTHDTPTNVFCKLDPLHVFSDAASTSRATPSDGNLMSIGIEGVNSSNNCTFKVSSGKWYFEVLPSSDSGGNFVGVVDSPELTSLRLKGVGYYSNGQKVIDGSLSAYGTAWTGGQVIGVAMDVDAGTVEFFLAGVSQGVIGHAFDGPVTPAVWHGGHATTYALTFDPERFTYTPPAGFKALCSDNMPDPLPAIATSGSFTGNANADGPEVNMGGTPETLSINGNAVVWGTHADKLAGGFKVRTASTSYNASGTNTWVATAPNAMKMPRANAQPNP